MSAAARRPATTAVSGAALLAPEQESQRRDRAGDVGAPQRFAHRVPRLPPQRRGAACKSGGAAYGRRSDWLAVLTIAAQG